MPPHRLAERNLIRLTNFAGSHGKHLYCVSTNHQPYASRWLNRTLLDCGLACLEGTSIAEATSRFDCPLFPCRPPKTVQTKRLDLEHLYGSALNARPQPRFTSPAAHNPSARSVPLRLRVRRSVHGNGHISNCWNQGRISHSHIVTRQQSPHFYAQECVCFHSMRVELKGGRPTPTINRRFGGYPPVNTNSRVARR
jgi:hypothetical protein